MARPVSGEEIFKNMSVPQAVRTMALPAVISQLIVLIYNLADTFFIGRTNDPYKVAAASLAFVLFFMMNALSNFFGVGGGSLISRLLGQQKGDEAKKVCSFSFYGTILISLLYSMGCLIFMDPLLRLLGASDNTIGFASQYTLWVVVIGGVPSTLGGILEGMGFHFSFCVLGYAGAMILSIVAIFLPATKWKNV